MKLSRVQLTTGARRNFTTTAIAVLVASLFGFVYPFLIPSQQPAYGPAWHAYVNGVAIGGMIGLALSFGELFVFKTRIRRMRFSFFIIVQTLYYVLSINAVVIFVMISHNVIFHGHSIGEETQPVAFQRYFQSTEFLTINAYAFAMIIIINFIRSVSRMLGQRTLVNHILGRYHNPVQEERIFMFLDIKGSTTIAEAIGDDRYHRFLNDFFYDITPSIIESKGEIYQYVGDEVVVTWAKNRGLSGANCLKCYFSARGAIEHARDRYEKKYGHVPAFKAGYHVGNVTAGLIGDIKRDIVFNGDTVNTAARIRSECTAVKRDLLLSGQLLRQMSFPDYLTIENMGRIKLRGREEEIELHSIMEAA